VNEINYLLKTFAYNNVVIRSTDTNHFKVGYSLHPYGDLISLPFDAWVSESASIFTRDIHGLHAEICCVSYNCFE